MKKLEINYDTERDVLIVEGISYSGEIFRRLSSWSIGTWQRIEKREDGLVTVYSPSPGLSSTFDAMLESERVTDG